MNEKKKELKKQVELNEEDLEMVVGGIASLQLGTGKTSSSSSSSSSSADSSSTSSGLPCDGGNPCPGSSGCIYYLACMRTIKA